MTQTPTLQSLSERIAQLEAELRSRDIAKIAVEQLEIDPERAMLLAIEAHTVAPTYDARIALQQALTASHLRLAFRAPESDTQATAQPQIKHATFLADNRTILTGSDDGFLHWWDGTTVISPLLHSLALVTGEITRILPTPNRNRALVVAMRAEIHQPPEEQDKDSHHGGDDGDDDEETAQDEQASSYVNPMRYVILDCAMREVITEFPDDIADAKLFFSDDGTYLVSEEESDVSLWDAGTGARLARYIAVGRCLGISRDGERALLYRGDGLTRVLELRTGEFTTLDLPADPAALAWTELNESSAPFSPDGTRVTCGRRNRMAYVWDANDGHLIHTLGERVVAHSASARFSPGGQYVLVQQNDSQSIEVWHADTGEQVTFPYRPYSLNSFDTPVRFLSNHDGAEFAFVGLASAGGWPAAESMLCEWRLDVGEKQICFRFASHAGYTSGHFADGGAWFAPKRQAAYDLSLNANLMLSLVEGLVRVYVRIDRTGHLDHHAQNVARYSGTHYAPDNLSRSIYTQRIGESNDYAVQLIDKRTQDVIASLDGDTEHLFSLDGRHLVTKGWSKPGVRVRNPKTGAVQFEVARNLKNLTALRYMPDQQSLLVGGTEVAADGTSEGSLSIWSLEDGAEQAHLLLDAQDRPAKPSYLAIVSADASTIAVMSSGLIHLWHLHQSETEARTRMRARSIKIGDRAVSSGKLDFSRDSTRLLAVDGETVRVWDVETLELICAVRVPDRLMRNADISPDKTLLATLGSDQHVRLWNMRTGKEVTRWHYPNATLELLGFSDDGRYLQTNSTPQMPVLMDDVLALARSRVPRTLTAEEQVLFLDM